MAQKKPRKVQAPSRGGVAGKPRSRSASDSARLPESAENFEHTLRRLTIAKQDERRGLGDDAR